jgi:hypothetical protein
VDTFKGEVSPRKLGEEYFFSADVAAATASIPRDNGEPPPPDLDRDGTGKLSVHGVRYVTHRLSNGPSLAVLSAGQCVNASRRNVYRGLRSISFARSTSSRASCVAPTPAGDDNGGVRIDALPGVSCCFDIDLGDLGDIPSSASLGGVAALGVPRPPPAVGDASANKYVASNTTAFIKSSFGGLYVYCRCMDDATTP